MFKKLVCCILFLRWLFWSRLRCAQTNRVYLFSPFTCFKNAEINVMLHIGQMYAFRFPLSTTGCSHFHLYISLCTCRCHAAKIFVNKIFRECKWEKKNSTIESQQLQILALYMCERPNVLHSTVSIIRKFFFSILMRQVCVCSRMSQLSRHEEKKHKIGAETGGHEN